MKEAVVMNRTKKLKINSLVSLLNRIVILVSGLILPRYILRYFGSEVNGLVASINQFLSIITFLDMGVGSVVQSALYKPLAEKDNRQISVIFEGAKNYFRRIAYVLILYVIGLIIFFPLIINSPYDYLPTVFLIFALSISMLGQYYFGIVNELLLNANQSGYVQLSSEIVVAILNLIASILLITQGYSIQIVKLASGLIFLFRPLFLSYYVNKNFDLEDNIKITKDPLPQKWSGMGQHIAYTIQDSTDITILTLFSTLENISVYSVYNMVIRAIRLLFTSLTTGMTPFFGDLLANNEINLLNNYFTKIEWLLHTTAVFLYGMTIMLINQFVLLYTSGVYDVDYYAPVFSVLIVIAYVIYSVRTPYRMMIFAAGHFKETQISSFIEASINIVISLLLVNNFGLIGVAIGTLISTAYQTLYLVMYLSKNIVYRPKKLFLKHIIIDAITLALMMFTGKQILNLFNINSFINWIIVAVILGIIFILIILIINYIFYKNTLIYYFNKLIKKK